MAATQTMTIPQFLSGNYKTKSDPIIDKLIAHFKKHKIKYRIVGTTIFIFLATADFAFAASTGIDAGGRRIYAKLLMLAKWTIIIKGGWNTINNFIKGDYDSAKKSIFSYLLIYIVLIGLPWALSEVDSVFADLKEE